MVYIKYNYSFYVYRKHNIFKFQNTMPRCFIDVNIRKYIKSALTAITICCCTSVWSPISVYYMIQNVSCLFIDDDMVNNLKLVSLIYLLTSCATVIIVVCTLIIKSSLLRCYCNVAIKNILCSLVIVGVYCIAFVFYEIYTTLMLRDITTNNQTQCEDAQKLLSISSTICALIIVSLLLFGTISLTTICIIWQ